MPKGGQGTEIRMRQNEEIDILIFLRINVWVCSTESIYSVGKRSGRGRCVPPCGRGFQRILRRELTMAFKGNRRLPGSPAGRAAATHNTAADRGAGQGGV